METFGEWLRRNRSELKLTREAFAARVGCSAALLRKIEDGERRPSVQIAGLIASCLDIPAAERGVFVRVARGELGADRLPTGPKPAGAALPLQISLPVLPSPLVGRQLEIEEICRLLSGADCRLLTLVGPGGIGKTRLAVEAASRLQANFPGGVFFVPLAPVNTARLVVPVIAGAIGFPFASASRVDPQTQLFRFLHDRQALLLVDNLEQLLAEPGIELLAELLAAAPQVKLLATSRESLGLQGEWVYEVAGLPVPGSGSMPQSAPDTAVELFLQRASAAQVGFKAEAADIPAIVRICQLVEGMPLGIELAAAWVRTLSCAEISREIERGLGFLSGPARDLPPRHRSMRAVFDHSWALLTGAEQAVLLRLSLFQGGFQREAAEQVAGSDLTILSALVAKSLVRRSSRGRFDLHELIHQFASQRFDDRAQEQVTAQARHCRYYLDFFGQKEWGLRSAAQLETLSALTIEMDNLRAAWDWAVTDRRFDWIDQAAWTITILCDIRGWLQEGLDLLDRAITALEADPGTALADRSGQAFLAHLLSSRGVLASRLGRYPQAQAALERSLEIIRPLNEAWGLVQAVTFLGNIIEFTGDYTRAAALYAEGLEIARAIGDRWFVAFCHLCHIGLLGITQGITGLEMTHDRLHAVVAEWRAIGDPRLTAISLNIFSWSATALERYDEARAALEESVGLCQSVGDRWGLAFAYRGLGLVAQAQDAHQLSLDMFRKSMEILAEIGANQDIARMLAEMSRSLIALGKTAEAEHGWREALRTASGTQGMFVALEALGGMASLRAKRGETEDALELLLHVLDHPATIQDTWDRADRLRGELEALLTAPQLEAVRARAQAKTFEDFTAEILAGHPPSSGAR